MAQRRLAAIMFSDIVGYTSLLKEDEKKAFETLRKNQRIHRRLIKKFNGRWLKEMESGVLASFSSITDAVTCALVIKKSTEEIKIPVRIGIHQGEVIFEKKDILGDGVNIASRIHSTVEENDIIISETVYNDIKNKEGLDIEFVVERELKGVSKPVGIYSVSCTDDSLLDFTIDTGELVQPLSFGRTTIVVGIMVIAMLAFALYHFLPKIINPPSEQEQSVLVLPCVNYTGTDTLDYFLAGMHDEMIGDIGKISALRVISTTTATTYKNTEKSIPQIASELGVNNIIEPSVKCLGDSICLQVKVMGAYPEEKQLWIHEFKVEKSEILNLYNTVTKDIAERIKVGLTPQEEKLLAEEARLVDPEAYDAYIKGMLYFDKVNPESLLIAAEYFKKAIEIDPYWASPYAGLAGIGLWENQMNLVSRSVPLQMMYKNLIKAIELDPNSANTHYTKAMIAVYIDWDWETGENEIKKALELNPNNAECRIWYAELLVILQRSDEALAQANMALELDPLRSVIVAFYAMVMNNIGDYQSAIDHCEKALSIQPGHPVARETLNTSYYLIGDYPKSIEMITHNYIPYLGDENLKSTFKKAFEEQGYSTAIEVLVAAEEEFAKEEFLSPWSIAFNYMQLKRYDKALDWLEKGYEIHDTQMPFIGIGIFRSDELKENPRYIKLMEKMNLPLP
jgi:TolB-like protein/tetratricopeptide (TPR) repeat protein